MYRRIKNSNIPYTSITKEVLLSLVKTLEEGQIGQIITAMYDYIYTGKEPSFNSKVMNGQWGMLIENLERMSKGYFSKADNGVASAKKRLKNKKKNQPQTELIESNGDFNVESVENIPCNIINEPAVEYRGLSHINPNISPQEEFISDEQKYGSDVMDLIESNPEIIIALKSVVEYHNGDVEKEPKNSPNEAIEQQDDIVVPQEVKSVSEGPKQGEFDNTIEEFENNIYNEDNMGTFIGYIPNFSVETRAEKTEFNVPKFIEYLKEHNNCLYNKMIRTPLKGLNLDVNMKRLKECIDGQLKVFLPDNTKRQQVYIYIIENNN